MEIARGILILSPYILIPLFLAYSYKKWNIKDRLSTYFLTAILIFFYPLFIFWINRSIDDTSVKCLNPEFAAFFGNLIIMVPACLIIQFIFNKIFKS